MKSAIRHCVAFAAPFFALLALPASAQDIFKGKTVNLYVGSGEGGPYDAYGRLVGRHIGKHLPGNPSVVVQNMPGASSRRLMNFMIHVAPKDGTAIGLVNRGVAFDPLMGNENFDVQSIAWLGSANDETNVCIVWHTSPIKTIDDLHTHEMIVGTSGPASTDAIYPNVLKTLYGLKFKVVGGYKSATDTHLAMERGEVDGRCGISYDTLMALYPEWVRDKKVRILIQIGFDKVAALGDIPSVFDLVKTDEQRKIWALWSAPLRMGRPFFAPPGLAPERAAILRRAFEATMADPELLAESAKMNLAVNASGGDKIAALLKEVYATPKDVVAKASAASKGK
jgi:tripartite-type tricarboxylate transporter receptor subunit TctC